MADINPEDCVTLAQFNELRLNMEARANRIAQDVQNILACMQDFRPIDENASVHGEEDDEGAAAARAAREA
ncbi:hypothetical protein E2562_030451 [Oryza meyeriana var. granulata]|uniref:Uncharacterized protein n=1 Tax=Oryza meyeriana var. granulata TaxID=110450 RepID=A0A6G1FE20_9ORYZ|nr:hypothetical protein E2562_030451 [Oryza meyeriana var. granulata]